MNRQERMMYRQRLARQRRGANDQNFMDQSKIRKDAGFKMTDEQHEAYKTNTKDFNKATSERQGVLTTAQTSLDKDKKSVASGYESLGDLNVDKAWDKFKKDFKEVNVYNGTQLEGTYYLPEETIQMMRHEMFNGKDGSYYGAWMDDDKSKFNVDVKVKGAGKRGKELHGSLMETASAIKAGYYEKAAPLINEAYDKGSSALAGASTAIGTNQGKIDVGQDELDTAVGDRATQLGDLKKDYQTGLAGRQKLAAVRTGDDESRYRNISREKAQSY